jgi:hypothetical protein
MVVFDGLVPVRVDMKIVGIAMELGGGGAYVSRAGYDKASGSEGTGRDIRLVTASRTAGERDRVIRDAERALDDAGMGVERSVPLDRLHAIRGRVSLTAAGKLSSKKMPATNLLRSSSVSS